MLRFHTRTAALAFISVVLLQGSSMPSIASQSHPMLVTAMNSAQKPFKVERQQFSTRPKQESMATPETQSNLKKLAPMPRPEPKLDLSLHQNPMNLTPDEAAGNQIYHTHFESQPAPTVSMPDLLTLKISF